MGDRMERLVILPFSFGCVSEASIVVGSPHPRRSRSDTDSPTAATSQSLNLVSIILFFQH